MLGRRDMMAGGGAALAAGSMPVAASAVPDGLSVPPPELTAMLSQAPLINLPRAYDLMAAQDIDGLIVCQDAHVYHLTNMYPSAGRMGRPRGSFALLSADPKRPPGIALPQFLLFYNYANLRMQMEYVLFPFSAPEDEEAFLADPDRLKSEPPARPARAFGVHDPDRVTEHQRNRHAVHDAAVAERGMAPGPEWGLIKAARELGLTKGRIAVDDPMIAEVLREAGHDATFLPADNLLRAIRFVRSPVEQALMRYAARANAEAALLAARQVRAGMTARELRAAYYAEAAKRGMIGRFMVIDSVSLDSYDATFAEGQGFSIDCVAHCLHYHGDFARTIFIGEPPRSLKRATEASAIGWDAIREALRPGLRYSEIRAIGRRALDGAGLGDLAISFTPHSVGLWHTDEPGRAGHRRWVKDDLALEEGMVLSVDCPVLMDGLGGSVHLEDLSLITADGHELLNAPTDRTVMV